MVKEDPKKMVEVVFIVVNVGEKGFDQKNGKKTNNFRVNFEVRFHPLNPYLGYFKNFKENKLYHFIFDLNLIIEKLKNIIKNFNNVQAGVVNVIKGYLNRIWF